MTSSTSNIKGSINNIIVIGAGFAGICMGIKLKEANFHDFMILERGDGLGGTWRNNVYPGCSVDIDSVLYSYSFEPNSQWTRQFSSQAEILAYLEKCVRKYNLTNHIRYNSNVIDSEYDEEKCMWRVVTSKGQKLSTSIIISAVGMLSNPLIPLDIPGLQKYKVKHKYFHSAEWDQSFEPEGKCIAIIGSGASVIQFLPVIAVKSKRIDLYQRSAPWVLPKADWQRSSVEKWLCKYVPGFQLLLRYIIFFMREVQVILFMMPMLMVIVRAFGNFYIYCCVRDPVKRKSVTPTFTPGCKRILLSSDYFTAINRSNVNVITSNIRAFTENGITTADGVSRQADVVIFGTGFATQDTSRKGESTVPIRGAAIRGLGGQDLGDVWSAMGGAEAFMGMAVPGFPNYFHLVGPNTILGHNSMVIIIESQVEALVRIITSMLRNSIVQIDVKSERFLAFNSQLKSSTNGSVWASGCKSWYLNEAGKNTALWPKSTFSFIRLAKSIQMSDFDCFRRESTAGAGAGPGTFMCLARVDV